MQYFVDNNHPHFRHGFTPPVKSDFIGVYYVLVITVIIAFTILDSVEIIIYVTFHKVLP